MRKALFFKIVLSNLLVLAAVAGTVPAALASEPIQVIEPPKNIREDMAELGKKLYFDPRLSRSGFISCNSCHNLSMGGTDNLPTSIGHNWQQGPINSPTVLNSSYNLAQFWDGRAADLKEQAVGPIENPIEMASSHELAIEVLSSIPGYVDEFRQVFGDSGVNIDKVGEAIAEFEETLVTPGSRFDQWLQGDKQALTADETEGYQLFKNVGCVACHSGPAAGGNMFQKMGLVAPYETSNPAQGRFDVTGEERDRMMFKVPTLRNVELTYPYFHDGAVNTLEEAVDIMARLQLARKLSGAEIANIVAFLKTLTGEQPQIVLPVLPPSNPKTPLPQAF